MLFRYFVLLLLLASCNNTVQQKKVNPVAVDSVQLYSHGVGTTNDPQVDEKKTDSVYKVGDFAFWGNKDLKFDFFKTANRPEEIKSNGDTLYSDTAYTILADYKKTEAEVFRKYKSKYDFNSFKVIPIYKGPFAKPDLKTDPDSRTYRTAIREACANDSISFAGHYTIAAWGCGSDCSNIAVIDRINGRVFYSAKYLPFDSFDGICGIDYRKDSRMIILNADLLDELPGYCKIVDWRKPEMYMWTKNRFVKLQ
ncbi:MAG TPA: hypothetical protein VK718_05040 [Ferruginibacter sp.]|jgi:hypothetical protein|nr:hypothetical protein [Ferruginibacter sp.]